MDETTMDETTKLMDILFPALSDPMMKVLGLALSPESMRSLRLHLWRILAEEGLVDGSAGCEQEVSVNALEELQLDETQRISLLLKVPVEQKLRDADSSFVEMLRESKSESLLERILGKSWNEMDPTELVDKVQDIVLEVVMKDLIPSEQKDTKSGMLLSRLHGIHGDFLLAYIVGREPEGAPSFLRTILLKAKRDRMDPDEVGDAEIWRMNVLERAPKNVVSTFQSLLPPVQTSLLYDAVFAVADELDRSILTFTRTLANGSAAEGWELDEVMQKHKADEKFISRVSSMLIVGVMKMQSRVSDAGRMKPNEEVDTSTKDKELLLSLLPDLSKKDKEFIHLMDSTKVNEALKKVYDSTVMRMPEEVKREISFVARAKQMTGNVDVEKEFLEEKEFLRRLAKDEELKRELFGDGKVKLQFQDLKELGDKELKRKCQEAKRALKNDTARCYCTGCGTKKKSTELMECSGCFSVWYCCTACQTADWKKSHKKQCKSLKSKWIATSNAGAYEEADIPAVCLSVPPSLTGYSKHVTLMLPLWDIQDKKRCLFIKNDLACDLYTIAYNVRNYFKLERLRGKADPEAVGNMCQDVFLLYLHGYKDTEGNAIDRIPAKNARTALDNSFMIYQHHTPVPKGWKIPEEDRPFIPAHDLAKLEKGIEYVRKTMGERDAI